MLLILVRFYCLLLKNLILLRRSLKGIISLMSDFRLSSLLDRLSRIDNKLTRLFGLSIVGQEHLVDVVP